MTMSPSQMYPHHLSCPWSFLALRVMYATQNSVLHSLRVLRLSLDDSSSCNLFPVRYCVSMNVWRVTHGTFHLKWLIEKWNNVRLKKGFCGKLWGSFIKNVYRMSDHACIEKQRKAHDGHADPIVFYIQIFFSRCDMHCIHTQVCKFRRGILLVR
jgi:hypothetical protein